MINVARFASNYRAGRSLVFCGETAAFVFVCACVARIWPHTDFSAGFGGAFVGILNRTFRHERYADYGKRFWRSNRAESPVDRGIVAARPPVNAAEAQTILDYIDEVDKQTGPPALVKWCYRSLLPMAACYQIAVSLNDANFGAATGWAVAFAAVWALLRMCKDWRGSRQEFLRSRAAALAGTVLGKPARLA